MIRERLHHRWYGRKPDGEGLLCSLRTLHHALWIDRYNEWHVARYGDSGREPAWLRPASRFVCWCADWRGTLCMRRAWSKRDDERIFAASLPVREETE